MNKTNFTPVGWALSLVLAYASVARADDELARRASWEIPSSETVQKDIDTWLESINPDEALQDSVEKLWQNDEANLISGPALLQRVIASFGIVEPQAASLIEYCQSPSARTNLPELDWLESDSHAPFVRSNMRLFLGKWFTMNEMYNEALDVLMPLNVQDVADPASLLFYRSAAQYRLRNKDDGLANLELLLENKEVLPKRYTTLAELMQTDLDSFEADSLDEIARLMESVRARLGLGRAGTRVRTEEDEIVKKLEKLIEEKEQQRQQMMAQAGGQGGGKQPSSPLGDSMLPEMQAEGQVDPKKIAGNIEWGNLPPKQREEALQSLGKEYPSHYREVIEEYFRKLAREEIAAE